MRKKDKNVVAFHWVQSCHAIEMEENLSLQNQLKAVRITIEWSKKSNNDCGDKIMSLQSKISLAEVHAGATDTWFDMPKVGYMRLDLKIVDFW